jgi:hypothetical protein
MRNKRAYRGNVEITAINEIYRVCQKAFCVWRPNHLTTECYSWLNCKCISLVLWRTNKGYPDALLPEEEQVGLGSVDGGTR